MVPEKEPIKWFETGACRSLVHFTLGIVWVLHLSLFIPLQNGPNTCTYGTGHSNQLLLVAHVRARTLKTLLGRVSGLSELLSILGSPGDQGWT